MKARFFGNKKKQEEAITLSPPPRSHSPGPDYDHLRDRDHFFYSPSSSPPTFSGIENENEQGLNSSCYVWLKILMGAAMIGGAVILLLFFPYLLTPLFKAAVGASAFIGAGLFYKGCRENKELQEEAGGSFNISETYRRRQVE